MQQVDVPHPVYGFWLPADYRRRLELCPEKHKAEISLMEARMKARRRAYMDQQKKEKAHA